MEILPILLAAGVIGIITLMLVEVREWRTGRTLISGHQLLLRAAGAGILLLLLAAIFVGDYILGLRRPQGHPLLFLAWWIGCLALAVSLLFMAFADLRHVEQRRRQRENEIWREFARMLAERIRRDRSRDKPDTPNEPD
jgi:drug/metabolite transporter (DMT)-like permease